MDGHQTIKPRFTEETGLMLKTFEDYGVCLASDEASYVTDAIIPVDGGYTAV